MESRKICLNGEWDFLPVFSTKTTPALPEGGKWAKIRVPSPWKDTFHHSDWHPFNNFDYPQEWSATDCAWYRRTFKIPSSCEGQQINLLFLAVLPACEVFCNGKKVGEHRDGFLPFQVNITEQVRFNQPNELLVKILPPPKDSNGKYLVPPGSWFGSGNRNMNMPPQAGIWQDVFLLVHPPCYIDDVFVITSVRKKEIEVQITLINKDKFSRTVTVFNVIEDKGKPVKEFSPREITLSPNTTQTFILKESWSDPELWSPDSPHLYFLKTTIADHGEPVHTKETRFGFREFWIEGHTFRLNGVRINLRGDAWHYQGTVYQSPEYARAWFRMCRETGINNVRLHAMPYPPFFLDIADEEGILITAETAIYGSGHRAGSANPRFWENAIEHACRMVQRDRNHPSVVIWSASNEMRWSDPDTSLCRKELPRVAQAMKKLDPTRPVLFDGDSEILEQDKTEIESLHYGTKVTGENWDRKKPLIVGEFGKWHYISPYENTLLGGEKVYIDFDYCQRIVSKEARLQIEQARANEVSGLCPFNTINYMHHALPYKDIVLNWNDLTTPGIKPRKIIRFSTPLNLGYDPELPERIPNPAYEEIKHAFQPVTVFVREMDHLFWENKAVRRRLSILNDTLKDLDLCLEWQTSVGEKVIESDSIMVHAPAGTPREIPILLHLPSTEEIIPLKLSLCLKKDGVSLFEDSRIYKVFPRRLLTEPCIPPTGRIAFYGNAESRSILANLGVKWVDIKDLSTVNYPRYELLIIGERVLTEDINLSLYSNLEEFVGKGGRVLILEQEISPLPDILELSSLELEAVHPRAISHPVLKNIEAGDLSFWGTDYLGRTNSNALVAKKMFIKPDRGNFRVIVEGGNGDFGKGGLDWAAILEMPRGKGFFLFSQIELIEKFNSIPPAVILLRNIINYAIQPPRLQLSTPGFIYGEESKFKSFFQSIGLDYERIESKISAGDIKGKSLLIVDGEIPLGDSAEILREFVCGGGRVLLLNLTPSSVRHVQKLLPVPVEVEPIEDTYQLNKKEEDILLSGISCDDLCWIEKRHYAGKDKKNFLIIQYSIKGRGNILLETVPRSPWKMLFVDGLCREPIKMGAVEQALRNTGPARAAMLRIPYGEGYFLVSQVLPSEADNHKVRRFYSLLLTNLGVLLRREVIPGKSEEKEVETYPSDEEGYLYHWLVSDQLTEDDAQWKSYHSPVKNIAWNQVFASAKVAYAKLYIFSPVDRGEEMLKSGELPDPELQTNLLVKGHGELKVWVNGREIDKRMLKGREIKIVDVSLRKGWNTLLIESRRTGKEWGFSLRFQKRDGLREKDLRYSIKKFKSQGGK
ncbi:MAG: hypothetical protein GXO71_03125 [Caldiserica bacterium]|nr:hypothetical protein [Caldisericota bacterium]